MSNAEKQLQRYQIKRCARAHDCDFTEKNDMDMVDSG